MKLAHVEHYRCAEVDWEYNTYVWVADDMTAEEFSQLCDAACEAHIKAGREAKNLSAPPPGYEPNYKLYPNKTVTEIQAIHAENVAKWNIENEKRKQAQKDFEDLLTEVSGGRIIGFYDKGAPIAFSTSVDWGHNHGVELHYGTHRVNHDDLPGSVERPSHRL